MFGAATIEGQSPTEDGATAIVAMQVSERDVPLLLAAPELFRVLSKIINRLPLGADAITKEIEYEACMALDIARGGPGR